MPNDLYVWEATGGKGAGARAHHCPKCFKPLTGPNSSGRCLGRHVEVCKQYHNQLFKKGTSSQCKPCNRSNKEQYKRYREIAELIHELKRIKTSEQRTAESSTLTSKAINIVHKHHHSAEDDSPTSKKERKAAKKARKLVNMPKSVSAADIDFVAKVLDPHASSTKEDAEHVLELQEDPDIMLNRSFHRGTSNRRDIRNQFVAKDKRAASIEPVIDPKEIDGPLQLLDVSPLTSSSSNEEKAIHTKLRGCVERYLVQAGNETDATMMRKAGFWRWASKRAYERLVLNVQQESSIATTAPTTSVGSSTVDTDATTEPDTDITTPSEEKGQLEPALEGLKISVELSLGNRTPKAPGSAVKRIDFGDTDDGWTTVGKPSKVKKPVGNITFVHNGGLAKIDSPVTPLGRHRGFATSYDHLY